MGLRPGGKMGRVNNIIQIGLVPVDKKFSKTRILFISLSRRRSFVLIISIRLKLICNFKSSLFNNFINNSEPFVFLIFLMFVGHQMILYH